MSYRFYYFDDKFLDGIKYVQSLIALSMQDYEPANILNDMKLMKFLKVDILDKNDQRNIL